MSESDHTVWHDLTLKNAQSIERLTGEVHTLNDTVKKVWEVSVTRNEFMPVRNFVYGMIGLVCVTVFGAIIALVIKK